MAAPAEDSPKEVEHQVESCVAGEPGAHTDLQLPPNDGLQWKIPLNWMITRGTPISGNLQFLKSVRKVTSNVRSGFLSPLIRSTPMYPVLSDAKPPLCKRP